MSGSGEWSIPQAEESAAKHLNFASAEYCAQGTLGFSARVWQRSARHERLHLPGPKAQGAADRAKA